MFVVVLFAIGPAPAKAAQSSRTSNFSKWLPQPPVCETRQITVDGLERSYILCVPQDLSGPAPLLLAFHGGGMTATQMQLSTGYERTGANYGFITAYLNGCDDNGCNGGFWNNKNAYYRTYATHNNIDDESFVRAVINEIRTEYTIDDSRIDATGLSDGGTFTYTLACDMSDIIAAINPVESALMDPGCNPSDHVAILHFHGGQDTIIPIDGGGPLSTPPVMDGLYQWAGFDGCSTKTQQTYTDDQMTCQQFTGCPAGIAVEWCIVPAAEHYKWPIDALVTLRMRLMQSFLDHPKVQQ